jgi:hypothetical protein
MEVPRRWLAAVPNQRLAAVPNQRLAARQGLDPKTTRRDIEARRGAGLTPGQPALVLTDEMRMPAPWTRRPVLAGHARWKTTRDAGLESVGAR